MIHREHILQKWIKRFAAKCIAVPHEFAAHDRRPPASPQHHKFEWDRGIRRGWPDVEICLDGGRTFRCELKAPGVRIDNGSTQEQLLIRLNDLGHPASWANSVAGYGAECERFNIPLHGNWRTIAQIADGHVAAEIAKQEVKAGLLPKVAKVKTKRTYRRATPTQYARIQAAMKPL